MTPIIELLGKIESVVNTYYKTKKDSQFYADEMQITLKQLNRFLLRRRGKSIAKLIDDRLHVEAVRLLIETDMPVKSIAYELDYCDPAYFTRVFKRTLGITPVEYRRINQI